MRFVEGGLSISFEVPPLTAHLPDPQDVRIIQNDDRWVTHLAFFDEGTPSVVTARVYDHDNQLAGTESFDVAGDGELTFVELATRVSVGRIELTEGSGVGFPGSVAAYSQQIYGFAVVTDRRAGTPRVIPFASID
ncbi:MAG: hypothetical protein WBX15_17780 [Thermoanaerobaculia bacterium]